MKAVIKLDVPEFQIGQDVNVYFKDTMLKKGVCEEEHLFSELKPCPFCGGKAVTHVSGRKMDPNMYIVTANIACERCGVEKEKRANLINSSFDAYISLFNDAIEKWNGRYPDAK